MKSITATLLLLYAMLLVSCDDDPEVVPEGTVRLIVNVNHHGIPITNAVVFRKNGTVIFPGYDTSLYETRYVADANGNLVISDVGNGDKQLVLYAKGIDPSWDTTQITPVRGYYLGSFSTDIGESKDYGVQIPVSE
jgi:hypothetical protein